MLGTAMPNPKIVQLSASEIPRAIRLIVTSEDDSVASLVGWLVSRDAQNLCGSGKTVKQVGRVARACSDLQIG